MGRLPTTFLALVFVAAMNARLQAADPGELYVGGGVWVRPAYEGAASMRGQAFPCLRYYNGPVFVRTTQGLFEGGVRSESIGGVVYGAQLAYEGGRVRRESAFLKEHNVADLARGASIGVHADVDWKIGAMPLNALVRYRRHIDSDQGGQADLRLTAGVLSQGGVRAGVFGQVTWSDSKAMQCYFGVTPAQAATTGLPAYEAGAGLRHVEAGVLGSVDLAPHWLVIWSVSGQALQGDARHSPIVQRRTSWYASAALAYRL